MPNLPIAGEPASDRELLELAAKAAGIDHISVHADGRLFAHNQNCSERHEWNPLTDDADALRLAVKLSLDIEQFDDTGGVVVTHETSVYVSEDYADARYAVSRDPYAATRRAIVRAAAAIGSGGPASVIESSLSSGVKGDAKC